MDCNINEAKPTSRVVLDGLFVMWLSAWGDVEIGFVKCKGHDLKLCIAEVDRDAPIVCSVSEPFCPDEAQIKIPDLGELRTIEVDAVGVREHKRPTLHEHGSRFDRNSADTCRFHFRWIFDMEGKELHTGRVGISPVGFSARMRIKSGLVYTACRSAEKLHLWSWTGLNPEGWRRGEFGPVAERTAVQLVCDSGPENGVSLTMNGCRIWLPDDPKKTYEIRLRNNCDEPLDPDLETHFRELYRTGVVVPPPNEPYVDFKVLKDQVPIPQPVCNGVYGGTI